MCLCRRPEILQHMAKIDYSGLHVDAACKAGMLHAREKRLKDEKEAKESDEKEEKKKKGKKKAKKKKEQEIEDDVIEDYNAQNAVDNTREVSKAKPPLATEEKAPSPEFGSDSSGMF